MSQSLVLYFDDDPHTAAALAPVAGIPLFKRTVLEARRAGVREVLVVAGPWKVHIESELDEDRRLWGTIRWMGGLNPATLEALAQQVGDEVLLVRANVLVDSRCLAALLAHPRGSALAVAPASAGRPDPAILRGGRGLILALLPRLSRTGAPFRHVLERLVGEEKVETVDPEQGVCREVREESEIARWEPELYRHLGTRDDGLVDRILHRPLARRLTRWLVRGSITPNRISLLGLAVGLLAVWTFWSPSLLWAGLGLLLYEASVILDHADGEVARLKFLESTWGGRLDVAVDTVIHGALTLAMGDIAARLTGIPGLFIAGVVAAVGVAASAQVVHLLSGTVREGIGRPLTRLATRDLFYPVLLAYLVLLGLAPSLLVALLGLLAVGTNLFWTAYLLAVGPPRLRARPAARPWAGVAPR